MQVAIHFKDDPDGELTVLFIGDVSVGLSGSLFLYLAIENGKRLMYPIRIVEKVVWLDDTNDNDKGSRKIISEWYLDKTLSRKLVPANCALFSELASEPEQKT